MGILIFFIFIVAASLLVCKNNFKKRTEELTSNLKAFNEEIKEVFYSIPEVHQENLLNSLTNENQTNLKSILNNSFIYGANAWSIQQQILKQQELLMELRHLQKNNI